MKISFANYNNSDERDFDAPSNTTEHSGSTGRTRREHNHGAPHRGRVNSAQYANQVPAYQEQPYNYAVPPGTLGVHDESDYVYDAQKGGYFNPQSNFFYDSTSGYFYDIAAGCYYYYETTTRNYIPYTGTENATASNESSSKQSEIDYTSAAAAIIEQAQAQANKIAQDNQNSAALDPSDTVKSPQQTPASLQFDIPQKTTKVKDIRVQKDINKWNAKTQELRTLNSQRGHGNKKISVQQQPPKEEKIEIFNKTVQPTSQEDTTSLPPLLSEEELLEQLKQKYEPGTGAICMLCRRNLSTNEKLLLHYQLSKLHSDNLAAQLQERRIQQQLQRGKLQGREEPQAKKQKLN